MNIEFVIVFCLFFLLSVLCLVFMGILVLNGIYFKKLKKEFLSLFVLFLGFFIYSILGLLSLSYSVINITILLSLFLVIITLVFKRFFIFFIKKNYCPKYFMYVGIFYLLVLVFYNFILFIYYSKYLLMSFNLFFFTFILFFYFIFVKLITTLLEDSRSSKK